MDAERTVLIEAVRTTWREYQQAASSTLRADAPGLVPYWEAVFALQLHIRGKR